MAKRFAFISAGVLFTGLGIAGMVMPFVPTTPLLLLAAICFGKSSRKLHNWLLSTRFYQKNIDRFVQRREMTVKTKLKLLGTVTLFMGFSFAMMYILSAPLAARVMLAVVWLGHVLYFGFKVKTIPSEESRNSKRNQHHAAEP